MTRLLESKVALVAGATRGADEATQAVTTVGTLHLRRISQKVLSRRSVATALWDST
jgi:hypothetical protein